jgi:hypothetical protein
MPVASPREFFQSLYYLLGNRRRYARAPLTGVLTVNFRDKFDQIITRPATLVDISRRGLRIECEEQIAPDTNVYVIMEAQNLKGFTTARYCFPKGSAYVIGLVFRDGKEISL